MFTHLFKLIWNKKRQNALLIIEMFVSFMVMFAVFTAVVYAYKNYKQPMGFRYDDVWSVRFTVPQNIRQADSVVMFHDALMKRLLSMRQIKEASFSGTNIPFSMNTSNNVTNFGNRKELANTYTVEDSYNRVLDLQMVEGRWFTKADEGTRYTPVVINEKLKTALFGDQDAVGKIMGEQGMDKGTPQNRFRVMGVVRDFKDKGSYTAPESGMYLRADSAAYSWLGGILLKVQAGTDAGFESRLFKTLSNAIGTSIEIEHLDKKLVVKDRVMLVPMIIGFIIAAFLIINVALGLFGVLWYNINKRRSEIGLRRAVGATGNSVSKQLVGEALVLSTISLLLGCFFTIQFPLLNVFDLPAGVYVVANGLAIVFIYLLVTICALYPGRQAAAIYPAVALHEE